MGLCSQGTQTKDYHGKIKSEQMQIFKKISEKLNEFMNTVGTHFLQAVNYVLSFLVLGGAGGRIIIDVGKKLGYFKWEYNQYKYLSLSIHFISLEVFFFPSFT